MKTITAIILFSLAGFQVDAKNGGVSLNEAVNQVKSEGRILSAKTINGMHEIKVLTPSGTVKTINRKSNAAQAKIKPPRPDYYNKGGQSMRDRKQNSAIPDRYNTQRSNNTQRNTMKLNTRQLDRQTTRQNNQSTRKNNQSNSKKKDK